MRTEVAIPVFIFGAIAITLIGYKFLGGKGKSIIPTT